MLGAELEDSTAQGLNGEQNDGTSNSGAVYIFSRKTNAWTAQGLNGEQNDGTSNSGAVYIFSRKTNAWNQIGYLKASNPEPDDSFGAAVSIDGHTLAASAVFEDSAATLLNGDELNNTHTNSGAVYVRRLALP